MFFCTETLTLKHMQQRAIHRWIKTECGRAKFAELKTRCGPLARLRLFFFVLIAAIRDWQRPDPDQSGGSTT